jgi:hypothetical protein
MSVRAMVRAARGRARLALALAVLLGLAGRVPAADDDTPGNKKAVAKLVSETASLIRRPAPDQPWKVVAKGEDLFAGELLIAVPHAVIETASGVHLEMMTDLERRSPFPIIETAVTLHNPDKTDLALTFNRGRIALVNQKDEGKATVAIDFRDEKWTLTMPKRGCRTAFEIYGRWPKGAHFTTKPKEKDVPVLDLVAVALEGDVNLNTGCHEFLLSAPPGNSLLEWDSITGCDTSPSRLDKHPEWADPIDLNKTPERRLARARLMRFRKLVEQKGVEEAMIQFLNSDDKNERRLGIYGLAAIDRLDKVGDALMKTPHEDVWDNAVLALRHWLGREPGNDQKFYKALVEKRDCKPAHAEIILQLTRSFGDVDVNCPNCYEMLIDYLKHDKQAIRGLAQWHLRRLVPAGRNIHFNPGGSEDERDKAFDAWKQLIPDGKLPPKVEDKEE